MSKMYVKCANMRCDFKGQLDAVVPLFTKKIVMGKSGRASPAVMLQFRCPKCSTRWRQKDPQKSGH